MEEINATPANGTNSTQGTKTNDEPPLGKAEGQDRVAYEERADEEWAKQVMATLAWKQAGDDWVLYGTCPKCSHEMDKTIGSGYLTDTYRGSVTSVIVACNCRADHAGRPEGRAGCGRYGGLELEL
jgi:hypothetical protein